ncbi:MAG TPA: neuraminidase (sialidase)-like protein, partial [Verrucomicrobiales bacterium]|nr:neuraminidase (sialidase)-like protein [Verrucomicrobiales bacterium]
TASLLAGVLAASAAGHHSAELIFPPETWHNHGSCIVEAPNGDLIVCWFHGSGERREDDVRILGARKVKATGEWTAPFEMADTPEFPDTNCAMIIDPQERLWLFWPTILANTWESAMMNYKISTDYQRDPGAPVWSTEKMWPMKPGPDFERIVREKAIAYLANQPASPQAGAWTNHIFSQAADKLTRRLGWFTRAHPYISAEGRMLVGLYSDGFSFSIVSYTDDWGRNWKMSEPMVGGGNIQPSFARKKDGTLVAYMRDNGPPPKRVLVSESADHGETWGPVHDHPVLPNPGAGLELMNLADGRFLVIYNDTEEDRHALAVAISDDEGQTYRWKRHLERAEPGEKRFHYPSIIQSRDGRLHCTYSHFDRTVEPELKTIKYATFDLEWVMSGDGDDD